MLLKNDSLLILQLKLDLVFDDNTKKNGIISVGDTVRVVYRRNGKKEEGVGQVKQITTSFNSANAFKFFINPTVLMDFSSNYTSNKVRIPVDDILDFEILTTGKYRPPFEDIILNKLKYGVIKIKKVYASESTMIEDFVNLKENDLVILEEIDPYTKCCANKLYLVVTDTFKYVMDIGDTEYTIEPKSVIKKPEFSPIPMPDTKPPKQDIGGCNCGNNKNNCKLTPVNPVDPDDNPNESTIIVTADKGVMDSDNPNIIPNLIILDNEDNPNL